jgi:hypothetical protein
MLRLFDVSTVFKLQLVWVRKLENSVSIPEEANESTITIRGYLREAAAKPNASTLPIVIIHALGSSVQNLANASDGYIHDRIRPLRP